MSEILKLFASLDAVSLLLLGASLFSLWILYRLLRDDLDLSDPSKQGTAESEARDRDEKTPRSATPVTRPGEGSRRTAA